MIDLIITDLHLNPRRAGGTTLESRVALEERLLTEFQKTLEIPHDRLISVGDIFDKETVSELTIERTFSILSKEKEVILLRGNHECGSMKYGDISSLQLLAAILPNTRLIFDKPETLGDYHFIPHCFNQEEFDKCIAECPEGKIVFVHANYDNGYTVEADHSLNLSADAAKGLILKGCHIIMGHEHAARDLEDITILGCLHPTSISDCLQGSKRCMTIENGIFTFHESWNQEAGFAQYDFTEFPDTVSHDFVRINGECDLVEFAEISRSIAKLRSKSESLIIAHNVKVNQAEGEEVKQQEVTRFNIIDLLTKFIDPEFKEDVESCI